MSDAVDIGSTALRYDPEAFGKQLDDLIRPIHNRMSERFGAGNLGPFSFAEGKCFVFDEEDGKFKWAYFADYMSEDQIEKLGEDK